MQKPDGLTFIRPDEIGNVLESLPIGELCGIGRSTEHKLNTLGVYTCGQLGRFSATILKRRFGVIGERLQLMGQGVDGSAVIPVEQETEVKTVGHSMTLKQDIDDRQSIARFLLQLSEMVGRRARRYGVLGKTVTLTLRYADFTTFSRQQIQAEAIGQSEEIYRASLRILDGLILEQPLRLLGVRLSSLQSRDRQLLLLPEERRKQRLSDSLDQVNDRHGEFSVMSASLLDVKGKGSHVISPAWRPEGIRNVSFS
jgi:DNA polymerase-4